MSFFAYLLRCADDTYYVGHTDDLAARLAQHQSGQVEGHTATRLPVELVWSENFPDRDQAFQVERQLKGWSRAKKEALIRGDFDAIQLLSRKLFLKSPDPLILSSRDSGVSKDPPAQDPLILSSRDSGVSKDAPCFDTEPAAPTQHERDGMVPPDTAPVIILVRPQLGENIGKAARAMLNFGLTEMRLVAPRDGWPNPSAGPAASGADQVLAQARVFDTVAEAIADCSTVFAATVRRRELMTPVVGPEQMAATMHGEGGRAAILFGPERSGLETEDVALADAIVTIPINPQFGSINLAQAVILLAYEWSRGQKLAQPTVREVEPVAPHAELDGFLGQLEDALFEAGYFKPPERTQVTKNNLRTIFTKARWTTRELRAIRGVIRILAHPRVRSNS